MSKWLLWWFILVVMVVMKVMVVITLGAISRCTLTAPGGDDGGGRSLSTPSTNRRAHPLLPPLCTLLQFNTSHFSLWFLQNSIANILIILLDLLSYFSGLEKNRWSQSDKRHSRISSIVTLLEWTQPPFLNSKQIVWASLSFGVNAFICSNLKQLWEHAALESVEGGLPGGTFCSPARRLFKADGVGSVCWSPCSTGGVGGQFERGQGCFNTWTLPHKLDPGNEQPSCENPFWHSIYNQLLR